MASLSLALPALARCERPRGAPDRFSSDHPGRLAQGPDEKQGEAGRAAGRSTIDAILPDERLSLGRGVPPRLLRSAPKNGKAKSDYQPRLRLRLAPTLLFDEGRPLWVGVSA